MQPLTYGLPTPWHVILIATIRHLKAAILQWNAQLLTVQLFLVYYLGVCWILRLSLSAYVQKCIRRGMVALPSSYMLLHNRPNVFRIWGFLTSSSQVWTFDINSVSAMSPSLWIIQTCTLEARCQYQLSSVEKFPHFKLGFALNHN